MLRVSTWFSSVRERLPKNTLRWGVLGTVVVTAIIVGTESYTDYQEQREKEHLAADARGAHEIAKRLGEVIQAEHAALTELAQDPRVVAAVTGADEATRKQLSNELKTRIPNALLLRLIPRGMAQTDPNSTPPLTYASLDLLLKSEHQQQATGAEIHLSGTPMEHIAIVRRVPPAGDPVGFLHTSLDSKVIREMFATVLSNFSPRVEVRQPVLGGLPAILASSAKPGNRNRGAVTVNVPGTAWIVSFETASTSMAFGNLQFLGFAVVIVALGFGLWWWRQQHRVVIGAATFSTTVYTGAIKAILAGEHPGLAQLLPGYLDGPKTVPAPRVLSEGLSGEDVTAFTPAPTPPISAPVSVPAVVASEAAAMEGSIDASIFRSYDIRGVVDETLTADAVYLIGRAFGSEANTRNQNTVIVARDGRNSSVMLRGALVEGLRDSGCEVLDIGLTPSPLLYFATHYLDTRTGVMVTGSHNAPQYNGLKMVLDGDSLSGEAIQAIRRRIEEQDFVTGSGGVQEIEIIPDYIRRISEEIPVSLGTALKVVVDCGNSVPGIVAPHILRAIGHDVIELFCEVDGNFPNHHPDPSQPENLADLIAIVKHEQADLGLAFDGDGDRLGVVDRAGNILWPDRQLMLFAQDVLSRNPGATIIYDVKCSSLLPKVIREAGGVPLMWKTGHSLIKNKMKETGALLAGEMSGHLFFKDRWYGFDDALYSAARLLEILVNANEPPEAVFARLPTGISTPELRLDMPEAQHQSFMQQVIDAGGFLDAEVSLIDGMRVELPDAWGLIRPSNTSPCLVLRFEGNTDAALSSIKECFHDMLHGLDPTLILPF